MNTKFKNETQRGSNAQLCDKATTNQIRQTQPNGTAYEGLTNDERASWAEAGLVAFGQRTGMVRSHVGDKEDTFLVVADLLCDMAHWCDRNGVDLPSALRLAASHYREETGGRGGQLK